MRGEYDRSKWIGPILTSLSHMPGCPRQHFDAVAKMHRLNCAVNMKKGGAMAGAAPPSDPKNLSAYQNLLLIFMP